MSLAMDFVRALTQKAAIKAGIVQYAYLGGATFAESEGLAKGRLKDGANVTLFCDQSFEAAFRGEEGQYSLKASVRSARFSKAADDDTPHSSNNGPKQTFTLATGLSEFDVRKAQRSLTEKYKFSDCLEYCLEEGLVDKNSEGLTQLRDALKGRTEFTTPAQAQQAALDARPS